MITVKGPLFGDLDKALAPVRGEIAEVAREMANEFVPEDTGSLRSEVDVTEDGEIVYEVDYARAVYETENAKWTTPGTGGHWDKKMMEARGGELAEKATAAIAEALS